MLIAPIITDSINTNEGYNNLLKAIDCKIGDIVSVQYLKDVYGFKSVVNIDLFNKLCEYKEILLDKLLGCNCLDDEHLIYITSRIQRLLDTRI